MKKFKYVGRLANGQATTGIHASANKNTALTELTQQGIFVTKIEEAKEDTGLTSIFKKKLKKQQVAMFFRQLSFLVSSGIPQYDALLVLRDSAIDKTIFNSMDRIASEIKEGKSLSQALRSQPESFHDMYVNQVLAGEDGGFLDQVLESISNQITRDIQFKKKVRGAMIYPITIIVVTFAIVFFLSVKVVPTLSQSLMDFGVELPLFTKIVLKAFEIYRKSIPFQVIAIIFLIIAYKSAYKNHAIASKIDKFKLNIKIAGPLLKKIAMVRFCNSLGALLQNGVLLSNALNTAGAVTGNHYLQDVVDIVKERVVKEGLDLSVAMRETKEFDPMTIQLLDVGSETGKLSDVLLLLADHLEKDVDNFISNLVSLIEPVLLTFVALLVGSVVISMLVPMFTMIDYI